jgi:hypothetical protein
MHAMKTETVTMTIREYLNECVDTFGNDMPSSVMYYFNGDTDGYEIEDFEITDSKLVLEGDLSFSLDIVGNVVDGVLQFDSKGDTIGIEFWF